jgi:hypothetical protein
MYLQTQSQYSAKPDFLDLRTKIRMLQSPSPLMSPISSPIPSPVSSSIPSPVPSSLSSPVSPLLSPILSPLSSSSCSSNDSCDSPKSKRKKKDQSKLPFLHPKNTSADLKRSLTIIPKKLNRVQNNVQQLPSLVVADQPRERETPQCILVTNPTLTIKYCRIYECIEYRDTLRMKAWTHIIRVLPKPSISNKATRIFFAGPSQSSNNTDKSKTVCTFQLYWSNQPHHLGKNGPNLKIKQQQQGQICLSNSLIALIDNV